MTFTSATATTTHCDRCASPLEDGDLRCCVCALPIPGDAALISPANRARILRCHDCGAAVAFSPDHQSAHCGFCGSVMEVESPVDPIEAAETMVTFSVDREAAETALRTWLARRGYFAPDALASEAVFDSLTPMYWAGWLVTARAQVTWTADSNAGAERSAWAPHAGSISLAFADILVPASRGLRHDECRTLAPYYDLTFAVPITTAGDAMIEGFELQRSAARRHVHRAIEAAARTRVERHVPGNRFRNVHVACLVEGQATSRVALPAWVLAYRYRGAAYRALVHGQRDHIVFGKSPIDWSKVARVVSYVAAAIVAIILAVMFLSGCGGGDPAPIDAPDFGPHCTPDGSSFGPLTGRSAVQGLLNVHVDAGGLIKVDTTSELLLTLDLTQTGTSLGVSAQICSIQIPDIPLSGQDMPIQFEIPQPTLDSVGVVAGSAALSSPDQTCADFTSQPLTIVLGAKLDPGSIATAPLPTADDNNMFTTCGGTTCADATGTSCACDQESDTNPGATLVTHNVPGIDLDEVYATLRTTFSLTGQVFTTDLVRGKIDATLDTGVLACELLGDMPCTADNVTLVKALNPKVTQQPDNPSTFTAVRVSATTSCADVIATKGTLFPP